VPQSTVTKQHGCQSFGCGLKSRGFGIGAAVRSTKPNLVNIDVIPGQLQGDVRQY